MKNKTLKEKIMRSQVEAIGGELAVEDVKQFIKEILDLRDLDNYGGKSSIEKMINKIKQKGDLE